MSIDKFGRLFHRDNVSSDTETLIHFNNLRSDINDINEKIYDLIVMLHSVNEAIEVTRKESTAKYIDLKQLYKDIGMSQVITDVYEAIELTRKLHMAQMTELQDKLKNFQESQVKANVAEINTGAYFSKNKLTTA